MFIRRSDYLATHHELASARAAREVLSRELAIKQQNVDWLTQHVNRLEVERAELIARVLDLRFPVPMITRDLPPVGMGRAIPETDRPAGEPVGVAAASLGLSTFEDVGDDLAAHLGIGHDLAGNVRFS